MGMAAGQARLLSITSRMSDNELRAQIINNNKMRLATESSQVSESYVQALNEAQMMFTSYDADNNASYQQLTFNALTSYNQYNNQYILSNAAGNVLLSEKDAENYRRANGSVTEFLKAYGLEQSTSYFTGLGKYVEEDGLPFKTGSYDDNGNEVYGYLKGNKDGATATELTEYLQALYEGKLGDTNLHPGYMTAVASEDYNNYISSLNNFQAKSEAYYESIADKMSNKLESFATDDNNNLSLLLTKTKNATKMEEMNPIMISLSQIITQAKSYSSDAESANKYFDNLQEQLNNNKGIEIVETIEKGTDNNPSLTRDSLGNLTLTIIDTDYLRTIIKFTATGATATTEAAKLDKDGNVTRDENTNEVLYEEPTNYKGTKDEYNYTFCFSNQGDENPVNTIYTVPSSYFNLLKDVPDDWKITEKSPNSLENMQNVTTNVIKSLRSAIYNVWDPNNDAFKDENDASYSAYIKAGADLSNQVFGVDVGESNYANLTDIEWIKSILNNGNINTTDGQKTISQDKIDAFQKIYDVYQLDCIINTYGEPNYTWIDKNDPNQNGEAKAQWYENLFERIQSGGYKVLQDGLASSNEWIQFAFESGIVTMEQVDSNKNWQSLIYQNCSDITEQTNDTAVAKAEAEYKAAMNKIENKDKRYDLELKNIDTEHNSLQTEYDSIKTAIDKNIERTFKLYS